MNKLIEFKEAKYLKYLVLLVAAFSVFGIIALGYFKWMWQDDYKFVEIAKYKSFFEYLKHDGDGRVFGPVSMSYFAIHKFLPFKVVMVIASSSYVLCCYLLHRILMLKLELKLNAIWSFLLFSLVTVLLWFGFKGHIAQTVYWFIGAGYIYILVFVLLWYYYYEKYFFQSNAWRKGLVCTAILVGMTTQNLAMGIGVILFVDTIKDRRFRDLRIWALSLMALGVVLITLLGRRLDTFNESEKAPFSIVEFTNLFISPFKLALPVILVAIFFAIILILLKKRRSKIIGIYFRLDVLWHNCKKHQKYLWASLPSILLFVPFNLNIVNGRYAIYFHLFLFMFVVTWVYDYLKEVIIVDNNAKNAGNQGNLVSVFLLCVFGFHLYTVSNHIGYSMKIQEFVEQREFYAIEKIQEGCKEVEVPILDQKVFPFSLRYIEMTKDPNFFPNGNFAMYIHADSVYQGKVYNLYDLDLANREVENDVKCVIHEGE